MRSFNFRINLAHVFLVITLFAAGPALADKGPRSGIHHDNRHSRIVAQQRYEDHKGRDHRDYRKPGGPAEGRRHYFNDRHRVVIHQYYAKQYRRGHCPPGLAKKHYQCVRPNHAKRWVIGRPLPREVVYYNVPPSLVVQLGPAPSHHRFVRVAQDILLLATGTGMVVDAVDNLNWEFGH